MQTLSSYFLQLGSLLLIAPLDPDEEDELEKEELEDELEEELEDDSPLMLMVPPVVP